MVNFINETKISVNENLIKDSLKLILRRLNHLGKVNMELVVVGDSKIKELNTKYRKSKKTTDVLSFPGSDIQNTDVDLTGSVVISIDTAIKQAKLSGTTLNEELQTLAGHGFLHLLNFHHK